MLLGTSSVDVWQEEMLAKVLKEKKNKPLSAGHWNAHWNAKRINSNGHNTYLSENF